MLAVFLASGWSCSAFSAEAAAPAEPATPIDAATAPAEAAAAPAEAAAAPAEATLVTRPLVGDQWTWLYYHLAEDTEGDLSPYHVLSTTSSSRVERLIQNLDVDNDDTAGSDLMYGGPGDDDLYGQFDDTNGPVQPAIGDEIFGETGEDAILGDNGTVTSWVVTDPTGYIAPNEPFIDDQVYLQGSLFRTVTLQQIPDGGNDRLSGGDQGDWMHGGAGTDLGSALESRDRRPPIARAYWRKRNARAGL